MQLRCLLLLRPQHYLLKRRFAAPGTQEPDTSVRSIEKDRNGFVEEQDEKRDSPLSPRSSREDETCGSGATVSALIKTRRHENDVPTRSVMLNGEFGCGQAEAGGRNARSSSQLRRASSPLRISPWFARIHFMGIEIVLTLCNSGPQ